MRVSCRRSMWEMVLLEHVVFRVMGLEVRVEAWDCIKR